MFFIFLQSHYYSNEEQAVEVADGTYLLPFISMMIPSESRTYRVSDGEPFEVSMEDGKITVEQGSNVSLVFETDALFAELAKDPDGVGTDQDRLRVQAGNPNVDGELYIQSANLTEQGDGRMMPDSLSGWIIVRLAE